MAAPERLCPWHRRERDDGFSRRPNRLGQKGVFATGFVGQVRQALKNIVHLLAEAGTTPEAVARLTWFVTDLAAYNGNLKEIGGVYREVFGAHYPAMTLVQVMGLVEPDALVEIEATAVIRD